MAVKTFKIDNKKYNFYRERFDYALIIDKIRNFKASIVKVEKEERNNKEDEFYVVTSKIYIDEFFIKSNLEKLIRLKIVEEIK